jgi:serine/threonine protein kinase
MALPDSWKPDGDRIDSGQAEVFPVRRYDDSHRYALKRLKNPARAARFEREVAVMQELHDAGLAVPEVVERGLAGNRPYFVMPWFEEGALAAQIDRGRFADDPEEGLRLLIQLAKLLAQLHEGGRAHRDVKPENVLLRSGAPYLTDFGLSLSASEEDPETRLTTKREGVGSRLYIAPENEGGFNESVDQRPADFYAFGKLGWAVLAGKPPPPREQQELPSNRLAAIHRNSALESLDGLLADTIKLDPRARLADWEIVVEGLGRVLSQLREPARDDRTTDDLVKQAAEVARRVRTSETAVRAKRAAEEREQHIRDRGELRQALSRGIQGRNEELSDLSNESAPYLRIQAGDGYAIGSPPTKEALLSVGLDSPPDLVIEHLPQDALVEGSPAAIQIAVDTDDPSINAIQLGLHPIVVGDHVWIVRAPQAIRNSPHAIAVLTTQGRQYGSWTGPLQLGLETTNAAAEELAVETIGEGIRLFRYCAEQLADGRRLSEAVVWGMRLWWPS